MYMRRSGIPFVTIAKLTRHKNLESLVKHYDLKLEVCAKTLVSCIYLYLVLFVTH